MFQGTGALAFNATFYLQNNPDVAVAIGRGTFTSALDHFIQFGQFEFRDPNAFFDTEYYLQTNPDVLNAIADPANPSVVSAFQHFVDFGSEEGVVRAPSAEFASFTEAAYLAANPDVAAAVAAGQFENGFEHFLTFGVNEVRPGSGVVLQPENPGQQFDLTVLANDNLVGTAGDDIFVGTATTIQATDRINGGSGNDTFVNIGSGATPVTPVLTGVENVVFQGQTAGITVDYSANADLDRLVFSGANKSNDATVAAGAVVAFDTVAGATAQEVNFKGATTGTVEVSNGSNLGTLTVAGTTANALTSLTIASTGTASTIDEVLGGTALKTVNFSGDGDVTVTDALAGVTTINAAAATGNVTVTVAAATAADGTAIGSVVTGGAGDDTFIFGGTLTTADTVNGGAGFDAVSVIGADYTAAADAAPFNNLKSIEQVIFTGASAAVLDGKTFTNSEITSLQFNTTGAGVDTVNAAGTARTYSFGEANEGAAVFNMKAGATTINLELDGSASTGAGADVGAVTVALNAADLASRATINIESLSAGTGDAANTTGVITAITGSTINITGDAATTIGGLGNAATVDASGLTGLLTINGSAAADTITVGSGGSVVDAGVGADTITLGAGVDRLLLAGGDSGVVTGTAPAQNITGFDVINGFEAGAGGDILNFTGVAAGAADFDSLDAAQLNTVAGQANLLDATNSALGLAADGQWTAFSFGGSTYAVFSADDAFGTGDVIVQLAGVNVTALTADNFDVTL